MRRVRLLTLIPGAAGLLLGLGTQIAFAADSPVPGTPPGVSVGTQPASASVGSSAQPNSSASVGSGQTTSTADGQNANHSTCGAGAGAAGSSFGAQPTQVGTSGTSTPTGCGSGAAPGGSTQGAPNSNVAQNRLAGANTGASKSTTAGDVAGLGSGGPANPIGGWVLAAFKLAWVLLAMLVAFLFFLLGAALARRSHTRESA